MKRPCTGLVNPMGACLMNVRTSLLHNSYSTILISTTSSLTNWLTPLTNWFAVPVVFTREIDLKEILGSVKTVPN